MKNKIQKRKKARKAKKYWHRITSQIHVLMDFETEHYWYWSQECDYRVASMNAFGPVYLELPKPGGKKYDGTEPESQICLRLGKRLFFAMCEAQSNGDLYARFNISPKVYNDLKEAEENSPIWFRSELSAKNRVRASLVFPPLGYGLL